MLIALLAYLLYATHGGHVAEYGALMEHVKPHVERAIPDEARRKEALRALEKTTKDVDRLNDDAQKDMGKLEALVRDYGSTPEAFDRLLDAASTENVRQAERIWSDRADLLAQVRAEEWSAIVAGARADAAKDAAKAHKEKTE